ncbi:hypothetical protein TMatcc_005532 [Talaromyces marneffei ATCC 18224]
MICGVPLCPSITGSIALTFSRLMTVTRVLVDPGIDSDLSSVAQNIMRLDDSRDTHWEMVGQT